MAYIADCTINPQDYMDDDGVRMSLAEAALRNVRSDEWRAQYELPRRIREARSDMAGSITPRMSMAPGRGGSGAEHRLEDRVIRVADLEAELDEVSDRIVKVNRALASLRNPDEIEVLKHAYMTGGGGYGSRQCETAQTEIFVSQNKFYRLKKSGLKHLADILFPA